jgi:hypothetical protein
MDFKRFDQAYVLRLEQGEEIVATLRRFCQEQGVTGGWVMGIGTVRQATLSYFVLAEGVYHHTELSGDHEITSLMGNISVMEGEGYPHLHATLSDAGCNLRGGHLSAGVISATGELVVTPFGETLERRLSPESGQRLLALD